MLDYRRVWVMVVDFEIMVCLDSEIWLPGIPVLPSRRKEHNMNILQHIDTNSRKWAIGNLVLLFQLLKNR